MTHHVGRMRGGGHSRTNGRSPGPTNAQGAGQAAVRIVQTGKMASPDHLPGWF